MNWVLLILLFNIAISLFNFVLLIALAGMMVKMLKSNSSEVKSQWAELIKERKEQLS